jgi:pantothenate kinase
MPLLLKDPVEHLLSQLNLDGPRRIIGLAGLPGSGKSTLATRLAEEVNARTGAKTMLALGMDGFHLSQSALAQMPNAAEAFARRGAPWTFDVAALATRLQAIRARGKKPVAWPDFQHEVGDPVEAAYHVPPETRLILVEGLYLLHQSNGWAAVSASFDERWYLDTSWDLSLQRLTSRHMSVWGLDRAAAQARIAANDGLNAKIVAASRKATDWWLKSPCQARLDAIAT